MFRGENIPRDLYEITVRFVLFDFPLLTLPRVFQSDLYNSVDIYSIINKIFLRYRDIWVRVISDVNFPNISMSNYNRTT